MIMTYTEPVEHTVVVVAVKGQLRWATEGAESLVLTC